MPTRNISLTDRHHRLITDVVASGAFRNASEVVHAGLQLLERQRRAHEATLAALRSGARLSIDHLDRGEYVEQAPQVMSDDSRRLGEEAAAQAKVQP